MTKHELAALAAQSTVVVRRVPTGHKVIGNWGAVIKGEPVKFLDCPDYIPPTRGASVPAAKTYADTVYLEDRTRYITTCN